jgi:hypothetical protein
MQADYIKLSLPLYTPEQFLDFIYARDWEKGERYRQAVTTGRGTYERTWKLFEKFGEAQGLGSPVDLQCGNKRYIGFSLSKYEYQQLIEPVHIKLKELKTQELIRIYLKELEMQKSCNPLQEKIIRIYRTVLTVLSPVPSLQSICKKKCEELGLIEKHAEGIGTVIENMEEVSHIPPNLICDPNLPPILNPESACIIS